MGSPLGLKKNPAAVSCTTESQGDVAKVYANGFVGGTSESGSRRNEIVRLSRVRDGNSTPWLQVREFSFIVGRHKDFLKKMDTPQSFDLSMTGWGSGTTCLESEPASTSRRVEPRRMLGPSL